MTALGILEAASRILGRATLPIFYTPDYRLPIAGFESSTGIEPRRADFVAWYLADRAGVPLSDFHLPPLASFEELARVHTHDLLDELARPAPLARVFAADPAEIRVDEIWHTVRHAVGGTVTAARLALERKGSVLNLLGGFHHAFPDKAGGLCPVNDIAVAIAALRADGFRGRVAILDLDAHPPDGTAACLARDPSVWIGSLSASNWGALPNVDEILLPPVTDDAAYLTALDELLGRMPAPDLAFVVAGGDVLGGDKMGLLAMTLDGVRRRDLRLVDALAARPAVWVPGGGYHADSWKVLAGTGLALTRHSRAPVDPRYDPLAARFSAIAGKLGAKELGGSHEFTTADMEESLGLGPDRGRKLLLGFYSAAGVELGFERLGILPFLRRLGFGAFRVAIDEVGTGDRLRLYGSAAGQEHMLVEAVMARQRVGDEDLLFVNWLKLENPLASFSDSRPRLPGQEKPGLGLARESGEVFQRIAHRLQLAGLAFRPSWYHMAFAARRGFRFVDPERQGRFEALVRDLAGMSLLDATIAASEGRLRMNGAPYAWEADDMVQWRTPHGLDEDRVRAERERVKFEVVAKG